tara:strand:+ start:525 stop:1736 length:1212 start_codon:yes stop_codon:yes gene_type:complete
MLASLPNELLWLILVYFRNEEFERDPDDGKKVMLTNLQFKVNMRCDPNASQGLAIVWKLVCKACNAACPWPVSSPLIGLCDTTDMLDLVRRLWNPENDNRQNAVLLSRATDLANDKLKLKFPCSIGYYLTADDLSVFIAAYEFKEVLKFFEQFPERGIGYHDYVVRAIRDDKGDVLKHFLELDAELNDKDQNWTVNDYLFRAIRCGTLNAVMAAHEAKRGFAKDEDGNNVDHAYHTGIQRAAWYGKLEVVKLLHKVLGYKMSSKAMENALDREHMHVAEHLNQFEAARCTVLDMMHSGHPNWTPSKLDERDADYASHYEMSAYEHLGTFTRERRHNKFYQAQQLSDQLMSADKGLKRKQWGGTSEEAIRATAMRRQEIWKEKQRLREAELAKRAAAAAAKNAS